MNRFFYIYTPKSGRLNSQTIFKVFNLTSILFVLLLEIAHELLIRFFKIHPHFTTLFVLYTYIKEHLSTHDPYHMI